MLVLLKLRSGKCCRGDGSMEEFGDKREADIVLGDGSIKFYCFSEFHCVIQSRRHGQVCSVGEHLGRGMLSEYP